MDFIFDIDGTLFDLTHRRHWVANKPKNWEAFYANVAADPVIEPVAEVAHCIDCCGNRIIITTGRPENLRKVTEDALSKYDIPFDVMYMRPDGDTRPDEVVKDEMLTQMRSEGYNPVMAFDDRKKIVDLWRSRGLVCAQLAEGLF